MTLQSKHVFLTTGLLREVVTTINAHRGDSDRDFLFLTKETGDQADMDHFSYCIWGSADSTLWILC